MSIAGPLYRRTPRLFHRNKPGDWSLVWCELHENGRFTVFADAHKHRAVTTLPVVQCEIAHVRSDGRDCVEISWRANGKKETLSSHESSYDIDWWMHTLLSVKRDLERGVRPRLSIVTPANINANAAEVEPRVKSMRRSSFTNGGSASNRSTMRRRQPRLEIAVKRFERYTVYETPTMFYCVCSDRYYAEFRLFSLNRAIERPTALSQVLHEDDQVFTWNAMEEKLQEIAQEAKTEGHKLVRIFTAMALVGCIRFLQGYHFIFVTQRRKIGCIGGNFIYGISATQELSVSIPDPNSGGWWWINRWFNSSPEEEAEARYLSLFHFIDLTKDFYFSYSYDVTHSLQYNMTSDKSEPAEMFTWNEYLIRELKTCLSTGAANAIVLPIVFGCYEQRKCSVFGRLVSITYLARRSRHFAGTRYLKRGVADTGMVANDVETEQIIEDENMGGGKFSSYVQHRGSIPVFWSQETSATMPKPPIVLNRVDPTYSATRKHCADLFARYGSPIVVLNLVKQTEKKEREVIVGTEFLNAVEYLNAFIAPEHRIRYVALDYSRLSKQKKLNVLHSLDKFAVWALSQTGFFCSAPKRRVGKSELEHKRSTSTQGARSSSNVRIQPFGSNDSAVSVPNGKTPTAPSIRPNPPPSPTIPRNSGEWFEQRGVLRTNCIDCLDRTNVGQFSVGMRVLGQQLYAMGIRNTPLLESGSRVVRVLMQLYSLVGDAISLQYGGSEAHKNVRTSTTRENVKSRELMTSIRRYYNNAFTDMAKQDAINVFLGHFVPKVGEPPLWELESDFYLHNFEVRNGTNACDQVRKSLELQAENKRMAALWDVASSTSSFASFAANFEAEDPGHPQMIRDKSKRDAYMRECKRLLQDWWKEPLDQFERSICGLVPRPSSSMMLTGFQSVGSAAITSGIPSAVPVVTVPPGKPAPSSMRSDPFGQMYRPEELTFFDKTLEAKFMKPVDLSNEANDDNRSTRTRTWTRPSMGAMWETRSNFSDHTSRSDDMEMDARSSSFHSADVRLIPPPTRAIRSMSAPDIEVDGERGGGLLPPFDPRRRQRDGSVRMFRVDENEQISPRSENLKTIEVGDLARGKAALSFVRQFQQLHDSNRPAVKRKEELMSIDEFAQGRGRPVGTSTSFANDSIYERHVHWHRSPAVWGHNEAARVHFDAYLRENNISPDDARSQYEMQVRAGATFQIQIGAYAGLDQGVKARGLIAKKLKTDPEDRRLYEESLDYQRLMTMHDSTFPAESLELYKSFVSEPLPEVSLTNGSTSTNVPKSPTGETLSASLVEHARTSAADLTSVGPLLKLNGGKDQDFIRFNEAAAANAFADITKNETELSLYK